MNFSEYVKTMSNKYKLVVALAISKTKPPDLTTNQYLIQLQEKLKSAEEKIDNFICSDDFDIDDDFLSKCLDDSVDLLASVKSKSIDRENLKNVGISVDKNEEKNVNCDALSEINGQVMVCDSANAYESEKTDCNTTKCDAMKVIESLRSIDEEMAKNTQYEELSQSIIKNSQAINLSQSKPPNMTDDLTMMIFSDDDYMNFDEDEEIELNSIMDDNFTQNDKIVANIAKNINKNYSNIIENNVTMDTNVEFNNEISLVSHNDNYTMIDINMDEDMNYTNQLQYNKEIIADNALKIAKNIAERTTNAKNDITEVKSNEITYDSLNNKEQNTFDSQNTVLYNVHGYKQSDSHISQSQQQNVQVNSKFIIGDKNKRAIFRKSTNNNNILDDNNQTNLKDLLLNNENAQKIPKNSVATTINANNTQFVIDKEGKMYTVLHTIDLNEDNITPDESKQLSPNRNSYINLEVVQDAKKFNVYNDNINATALVTANDNTDYDQREKYDSPGSKKVSKVEILNEEPNFSKDINQELTQLEQELELAEDEDEVVPFKILKEFSKLKAYLEKERERTEDYSTDSGYKSDSQRNFKSSYKYDTWLNQAGHSLLNYIVNCSLIANTEDIVKEISQVLGKLIDKMHEEEKYPPLIEELLNKVDYLLKDIYNGSGNENALLEKDESLQRLLLMNKSVHIQHYTIEKICLILQDIHKNFTSKETLYELKDINRAENLNYIFFVLENLIKNYLRNKETLHQSTLLSQSSQNSQKLMKKSSITDFWRKKWNSAKETNFAGSQEKVCVLSKCGDVLNKIIVDCMDGYSLISFAALQCFNLLQN